MCFGYWFDLKHTLKELFLSKMKKYGIKSAVLTILGFWRVRLETKEEVKQNHLEARKNQVENDELEKQEQDGLNVYIERIISEDLELFYMNLQNPDRQHEQEYADIYSTKKLNEEELNLLKNRNKYYLSTFSWYEYLPNFESDMKEIKESSDPDSIFSESCGFRLTFDLEVTLRRRIVLFKPALLQAPHDYQKV